MTKEELKQYLKENLTIDTKTEDGCYGSKSYTVVTIYLEGEPVSSCWLD